ncbi:hypothetical protein PTTG_27266 [Puccinia triticina 1-1 BBBD Race 1]|uniref:Uncharacterized protein n=1 Tax=Puccinia triticina (isolate 1-1 / race 1 (BBBD)) TaxID=630390 RepID=A0A180GLC5_PUCT1|nr:hypothetical protein PTTG_27266 [Puccinia triticina 1-1 BBBD Race 1]
MRSGISNLGFLLFVTTCIGVNESPQRITRDVLSPWIVDGNTGDTPQVMHSSNWLACGSAGHEQTKEFHLFSKSDSRPPLSSGNWEGIRLRDPPGAHSRTKHGMPLEPHIQTPSTKRRKEDEIRMESYVDPGSPNAPQTIDLFKLEMLQSPDPSTNLDKIPIPVVFGAKLVHSPTPDKPAANRHEPMIQADLAPHGETQPPSTPVHEENARNSFHQMPGNPASIEGNLEEPLQQSESARGTTLSPNPTPDKTARLDEQAMQAVSSHRAERSGSSSVQIEGQAKNLPLDPSTLPIKKRKLRVLETIATDDTVEGSSLHSDPKNVDDSLPTPIIQNRASSRQKKMRKATKDPHRTEALESQPSSSRDGQFTRVKFTYEVLQEENPLPEDGKFIRQLKKLCPDEKKEIVIYESSHKKAFKRFQKCVNIMKGSKKAVLAARYKNTRPRRKSIL